MTLLRASLLVSAVTLLAACGPDIREGDAGTVTPGAAVDTSAPSDPRVLSADMARIKGSESAPVWLVMVSDFQCPACKHWHDTYAAEIERDYVESGKVRFAYINFPLNQHRNARDASEAAMCAAAQGRFWEMHDRIFATQDTWAALPDPVAHFRALATQASVDTADWNACLADNVLVPMIDGDYQRGMTGGVNQTPTFFVGSQVISGAIPARELRPLLDSAIARAGGGSR